MKNPVIPIPKPSEQDEKRFWEKVNKDGRTLRKELGNCWEWIAASAREGYGIFRIGSKSFRANRVSWVFEHGELSVFLHVCHHCDNPRCVRPEHLFLGTDKDNIKDCQVKGRRSPAWKQLRNSKIAKLTEKMVLDIRSLRGIVTPRILAKTYGVSRDTIIRAQKRIHWKHI